MVIFGTFMETMAGNNDENSMFQPRKPRRPQYLLAAMCAANISNLTNSSCSEATDVFKQVLLSLILGVVP